MGLIRQPRRVRLIGFTACAGFPKIKSIGPVVLIAIAICVASCSQEVEYSDQQRACIAQRYREFDARNLSQCVDVCKACMTGTTVTCTTSCKLKGAG
jgi:hypothetical protein